MSCHIGKIKSAGGLTMRKDTTFSDGKLTNADFSKKYWLGGDAHYQYHRTTIENGRDEREQFIFNDLEALYRQIKFYAKYNNAAHENIRTKQKRLTALAATSAVVGAAMLVFEIFAYLK
jgi:hypothetical protein